ncbi:uncharacterized protein G2W53_018208 [Senna tora]|uniref:Uncharacterized protein n=1 Tax=Senna tora TaxID=362788 RepID=A0A834WRG8_9FABA|nr:uncharacterized protein G2W53_018208 [Senna tora]
MRKLLPKEKMKLQILRSGYGLREIREEDELTIAFADRDLNELDRSNRNRNRDLSLLLGQDA